MMAETQNLSISHSKLPKLHYYLYKLGGFDWIETCFDLGPCRR